MYTNDFVACGARIYCVCGLEYIVKLKFSMLTHLTIYTQSYKQCYA